jgi:hypothetical protein
MKKAKQSKPAIVNRTKRGPEPERFKITGYASWEEAAAMLVRKPKPTERGSK